MLKTRPQHKFLPPTDENKGERKNIETKKAQMFRENFSSSTEIKKKKSCSSQDSSPNPESLSLRKSNICLSQLYHYKSRQDY